MKEIKTDNLKSKDNIKILSVGLFHYCYVDQENNL